MRAFNLRDFGGQNQSWDFTQDKAGNIYAANSGGVFRFDGSQWTSRQLPGHPVVRTVLYNRNKLYAGGYGEFGYWEVNAAGEEVYHSISDQLTAKDPFTEEIWNIVALDNDLIVFQSFTQLFVFDGKRVREIASPGLLMFAQAAGDTLLVPNSGIGVGRWQEESGYAELPNQDSILQEQITGIISKGDTLLLATAFDGIYQWTPAGTENFPVPTVVINSQINRLLQLSDGRIAVGTLLDGLFILSPDGRELDHHLNQQNGLQNNTVLALFEDSAGDLWVGLDAGIDLVVISEPVRYFTAQQQAVGAVYAAIEYDDDFYLGTNQGLYAKAITSGEAKFQLIPNTTGQVWELSQTEEDLLCGHNEGTFDIRGEQATLVSDYTGGWQIIACPLAEDTYLQANYTGVVWLEKTEQGWTSERMSGIIAPLRYITWIGPWKLLAIHGSRGAYALELDPTQKRIVKVDTLDQPKLTQAQMVVLDQNILVKTSQEGILNYQIESGYFTPVPAWNGVQLDQDAYVLPGRAGTDEWFLISGDQVNLYRATERLASLPISIRLPQPKIIPWRESDYLLCLDDGYAIMQIGQPPQKIPPVNVGLQSWQQEKWHHPTDRGGIIQIPYAQNRIRLQFSQHLFDRPVKFSYRLKGLNNQWSEWSGRSEQEFTTLPSGDYQFELLSNWSDEVVVVRFAIANPWYRKPWAYAAYLLVIAVVGRLLFQWHKGRLERQARSLDVKRERELQKQKILARNEQLRLDNQRKSKELANSTLALARRNENLLQLQEQLQVAYQAAKTDPARNRLRKMLRSLEKQLQSGDDWAIFESHFEEVHEAFLTRLRRAHPKLTAGDLKLAAYLRMSLSSKEIAPLLHISLRGVENKRYRLRTKLELSKDTNLNEYLARF
ncbi:MAG: triple tyrosine motif-containing protein [Bacteroidota bacterium]